MMAEPTQQPSTESIILKNKKFVCILFLNQKKKKQKREGNKVGVGRFRFLQCIDWTCGYV